MTTQTAIATKQNMTLVDFQNFMSTLSPATESEALRALALPNHKVLEGANDALYLPLHNAKDELTGLTVIASNGKTSVIQTGNPDAGYFFLEGERSEVILLTDNITVASMAQDVTEYSVAILGSTDDLGSVSCQLAPYTGDTVVLYCLTAQSDVYELLISLGIEGVDCSSDQALRFNIENAVEVAKLRIPKGFVLKNDGVYVQEKGKDAVYHEDWLCSPLKVSALTRDIKSESWGRYVEVLDRDNIVHEFAMPVETIIGSGFMGPLVHRGLVSGNLKNAKALINEYLLEANPIQRARSVSETGWYNDVFVFPEKVIGETDEKVVYQSATNVNYSYDESGSLEEWKNHVAALCVGNSRLAFGVSTAFATMLLKLVNGESGGIHFRSGSSRGKTTILTMAKSVFGNPKSLPRWRATVDGLEGLAASHNHTLLCLDEFGQLAEASPKRAGEAIYMLGNGEGKQRSKSNGAMLDRTSWQLLYLSAGEVSLKSVMEKAGLQVRGGQEVRFIDLPADAGAGLGAFDTIQGYEDGNQFALAIKDGALQYYGTAATAFLGCVSEDYEGTKINMLRKMDAFITELGISHADPQVHRVAQRFAQIAAAGEIATEFGVTGWEVGEASRSAKVCFDAWVEMRGGRGSQEEMQVLEQISGKLLQWGLLRLNTEEQAAARNGRVWGMQDDNYIYVYVATFKSELCEGLDVKNAERVLLDNGVIIPSRRTTTKKRIDGKPVRVYKLDKKILAYPEMELDEDVEIDEPSVDAEQA